MRKFFFSSLVNPNQERIDMYQSSIATSFGQKLTVAVAATACLGMSGLAMGAPFYQGGDVGGNGQVVFEAEGYTGINSPNATTGDAWVTNQVSTDGTTDYDNASGDTYIRDLPDDGSSAFTSFMPPTTSYDFRIDPSNDGEDYYLNARFADTSDSSQSDRIKLRLFTVDSGSETQIFEQETIKSPTDDGDFDYNLVESDATGGLFTLESEELYRLRLFVERDGVAVDQFAFTEAYSTPDNDDPPSASTLVVPEPASAALLAVGGGLLILGRRRRA